MFELITSLLLTFFFFYMLMKAEWARSNFQKTDNMYAIWSFARLLMLAFLIPIFFKFMWLMACLMD